MGRTTSLASWLALALVGLTAVWVPLSAGAELMGAKSALVQLGGAAVLLLLGLTGRRGVQRLPWPVWLALGGVLGATVLATAHSVYPVVSLLGTVDRGDGLLELLAMLAIFVACAGYGSMRGLAWMAAIAGGIVGLYATAQFFGIDVLASEAPDRPLATFGNPDVLASWLALSVPLTLWLARPRGLRVSAVLQGLALLASSGGAAVVGLAAAGAALARQRYVRAGLAALVGLAALLLVWRMPPTLETRLSIWAAMPAVVAAHPVLGTGPETLDYALAGQEFAHEGRAYADRAHNAELDILATSGLVGLVAWAALALVVVVAGWQALRAGVPGARPALLALLAHGLDSQLSIEVVPVNALAFAVAGTLVGLNRNRKETLTHGVSG